MKTELLQKLDEAQQRLEAMSDAVQMEKSVQRLTELEEAMAKPGFWDNNEKAQEVIQEAKNRRTSIYRTRRLHILLARRLHQNR